MLLSRDSWVIMADPPMARAAPAVAANPAARPASGGSSRRQSGQHRTASAMARPSTTSTSDTLTANPSPARTPASPARRGSRQARPEHYHHGGNGEDRGLDVDVGTRDQQLQQQRVGRPQQSGAQLAVRIASGRVVQQQRGAGEGGQIGQAEHEHGEPRRGTADQRGQALDPGGQRPVDRGGGEPVLHGPGHRITQRGQLGGRGGVRVVAGDQHPPVGGVAELVRRSERRDERQHGGGQQPGDQHGPGRYRPAAAQRAQHEHQPERAGRQRGRGERDGQVGRQVRGPGPRRLPGPARQHGLHDRWPGHRDREGDRHADADGNQPRASGGWACAAPGPAIWSWLPVRS